MVPAKARNVKLKVSCQKFRESNSNARAIICFEKRTEFKDSKICKKRKMFVVKIKHIFKRSNFIIL